MGNVLGVPENVTFRTFQLSKPVHASKQDIGDKSLNFFDILNSQF